MKWKISNYTVACVLRQSPLIFLVAASLAENGDSAKYE